MRGHKVRKWKSKAGSITVEAAFVMPFVLLTVFMLIDLSFYLHDICRIQSIVDLTAHKAGLSVKYDSNIVTGEMPYEEFLDNGELQWLFHNTEREKEVLRKSLEQELSRGLFLVRISSIEASVSRFWIVVRIKTDMAVSLPLFSYLFTSLPDKTISCEYPAHNPAETVRCLEVILDTGKAIKGLPK